MKPTLLLEPQTGTALHGARRHLSSHYYLEIVGFSALSPSLPHPAELQQHHDTLCGTLPLTTLQAWIAQLQQQNEPAWLGEQLATTLTQHQTPAPTLLWGKQNHYQLNWHHPLIMGIVNVTPDSFSDGDPARSRDESIAHGLRLVEEGADILDIGGESTRPGAQPVPLDEELARVIPVIAGLANQISVPISIDTSKAKVMEYALNAGAAIINDVTALQGDPNTAHFLTTVDAPIILMHMQNHPATMQLKPHYQHVVAEVYQFLQDRIQFAVDHGIARSRLMVDVGIGFGKQLQHNVDLLKHLGTMRGLGAAIVLGVSRKRMIGEWTGESIPKNRDPGSQVLAAMCAMHHADIVRVHHVAGTKQAIQVMQAMRDAGIGS